MLEKSPVQSAEPRPSGQMAIFFSLQGKLMATCDSELILLPFGRGDRAIELALQRILFQLNQHLQKEKLDCTVCK